MQNVERLLDALLADQKAAEYAATCSTAALPANLPATISFNRYGQGFYSGDKWSEVIELFPNRWGGHCYKSAGLYIGLGEWWLHTHTYQGGRAFVRTTPLTEAVARRLVTAWVGLASADSHTVACWTVPSAVPLIRQIQQPDKNRVGAALSSDAPSSNRTCAIYASGFRRS